MERHGSQVASPLEVSVSGLFRIPWQQRDLFMVLSIGLMALARAADVLVTYQYSPELAFEGNPMVRDFGMGWPFLLAVNFVAVALAGYCAYCLWHQPGRYERSAEVHDIWSFASFACYHHVYSKPTFLLRRLFCAPNSWRHTLRFFGAVTPPVFVAISAVAVFSWYAMYGLHWDGYSQLYNALWPFYPYAIVVPVLWVSAALFYRNEYRRYCTEENSRATREP